MSASIPTNNKTLYWKMYRSFVGIATLCAVIIVLIYQWTAPVIQENKQYALDQAIFKVLPAATSKKAYRHNDNGVFVINNLSDQDDVIYAAYDTRQQLVGIAIPAQGMGYQDSIQLLYAYDPTQQTIIGMHVLQSRETPGLGSRIESDLDFLANFSQLDVQLNIEQTKVKNALQMVKTDKKIHSWQIDSISGATVSSKAVGNILQQSVNQWLPIIKNRIEDFTLGK